MISQKDVKELYDVISTLWREIQEKIENINQDSSMSDSYISLKTLSYSYSLNLIDTLMKENNIHRVEIIKVNNKEFKPTNENDCPVCKLKWNENDQTYFY